MTTVGYEVATTVIYLAANLNSFSDKKLLRTSESLITDARYVDLVANAVMKNIGNVVKEKLVKTT